MTSTVPDRPQLHRQMVALMRAAETQHGPLGRPNRKAVTEYVVAELHPLGDFTRERLHTVIHGAITSSADSHGTSTTTLPSAANRAISQLRSEGLWGRRPRGGARV